MTLLLGRTAVLGTLAERPDPADPSLPREGSSLPAFIALDTGDIWESTGTQWIRAGQILSSSGSDSAGISSDEEGGLSIDNSLVAGALATGPVPAPLLGTTPDPTYNPAHTYTVDDLTTTDSWYGPGGVTFLPWTPTESGTLLLLPPENNGTPSEIDFFVFTDSVIGVDVPSRDGTGSSPTPVAHAYGVLTGPVWATHPDFVDVSAGQTYTLALFQYPDDYSTASTVPGHSVSFVPWIRSTQVLGGQATLVTWHATASGSFAHAEGDGSTASGLASHAEGNGTTASGNFAHAQGDGSAASGTASHAEGNGSTIASGTAAHAEGTGSTALGTASHAEGEGTLASGESAHAEGNGSTASRYVSHAEGNGSAALGTAAHAEGNGSAASGDSSHAEGASTTASGYASHAEGTYAQAAATGEHASGSGLFSRPGDAQYSRLVTMAQTINATSTLLGVGDGRNVAPSTNETWTIEALVCAARADVPGTVAGWRLAGLITNTGGTLRIVGTPESVTWGDGGASTWTAALDITGGFIRVAVTGEEAKTIRWVATLHITKVGG